MMFSRGRTRSLGAVEVLDARFDARALPRLAAVPPVDELPVLHDDRLLQEWLAIRRT
jgi:hypothetical protein